MAGTAPRAAAATQRHSAPGWIGMVQRFQLALLLLLALCAFTLPPVAAEDDEEHNRIPGEPLDPAVLAATGSPCPRRHPFASRDGKECCVHLYTADDECHPSYDAVACDVVASEPCVQWKAPRSAGDAEDL